MTSESNPGAPSGDEPAGEPTMPKSRIARRLMEERLTAEQTTTESEGEAQAGTAPPAGGAPPAAGAPPAGGAPSAGGEEGATRDPSQSDAPEAPSGAAAGTPDSTADDDQRQSFVYEELPEEMKTQRTRSELAQEAKSPKATGRRLRRLLDEDIDADLAEAMVGFEGEKLFEAVPAPPPPPSNDRKRSKDEEPSEKNTVRVISVRGENVFVDLGEKSEGIVPLIQFEDKPPKDGDLIEVVLAQYDAANELYLLRLPGATQEADWSTVEKGMVVNAHVDKVNKGGLSVTVNGLRGFMPAGQVDLAHIDDLSIFVGSALQCQVMEVNRADRNLVVSHKIVLEKERAEQARQTLATLEVGQVREGIVKSVRDFGAFVDIGGVDGLVHVSQMSWSRIGHPSEVLFPGQEVKVKVLSHDSEAGRIGLGLRQLTESPWGRAEETYRTGVVVSGEVTKLMDFGAFVELEPGIEGLIHISELATKRIHRVSEVLSVGQAVEVKVLGCDVEQQRISLSFKQALAEAEAERADAAETVETATASGSAAEEPTSEVKKKPQGPLKGGLGGGGGPLFG